MDKLENSTAGNLYRQVLSDFDDNSNESIDLEMNNENSTDLDGKSFPELFADCSFLEDKKLFELNFLDAIKNYDIEDFFYSFADKTFSQYLEKYNIGAVEWLNDLLLRNMNNASIVCGILKVLSNVDYEHVQSFGFTMLTVVIYNYNDDKDIEVSDLIISCIENWDNPKFMVILESLKTQTNFIELYKRKVKLTLAA